MKDEIEQLLLKYKHGKNIHEHRKPNDLHKFDFNKFELTSSNKHVILQNLSIYYTQENKENTTKTVN